MNGCGQLIGIKGRAGHWMDQIQFVFDQQPIENCNMIPVEIDAEIAFQNPQKIIGTEAKLNSESKSKNDLSDDNDELKDQESIMIQSLNSLQFVQIKKEPVCIFGKYADNIQVMGKPEVNLGE